MKKSGFTRDIPSVDTSGILSDKPTKYHYQVPIIDTPSAPSETLTEHTSYVPK